MDEIRSEVEDLISRMANPPVAEAIIKHLNKLRKSSPQEASDLESAVNGTVFDAVQEGFKLGWACARKPEILVFKGNKAS